MINFTNNTALNTTTVQSRDGIWVGHLNEKEPGIICDGVGLATAWKAFCAAGAVFGSVGATNGLALVVKPGDTLVTLSAQTEEGTDEEWHFSGPFAAPNGGATFGVGRSEAHIAPVANGWRVWVTGPNLQSDEQEYQLCSRDLRYIAGVKAII